MEQRKRCGAKHRVKYQTQIHLLDARQTSGSTLLLDCSVNMGKGKLCFRLLSFPVCTAETKTQQPLKWAAEA